MRDVTDKWGEHAGNGYGATYWPGGHLVAGPEGGTISSIWADFMSDLELVRNKYACIESRLLS